MRPRHRDSSSIRPEPDHSFERNAKLFEPIHDAGAPSSCSARSGCSVTCRAGARRSGRVMAARPGVPPWDSPHVGCYEMKVERSCDSNCWSRDENAGDWAPESIPVAFEIPGRDLTSLCKNSKIAFWKSEKRVVGTKLQNCVLEKRKKSRRDPRRSEKRVISKIRRSIFRLDSAIRSFYTSCHGRSYRNQLPQRSLRQSGTPGSPQVRPGLASHLSLLSISIRPFRLQKAGPGVDVLHCPTQVKPTPCQI